jgi:hypothetical protein
MSIIENVPISESLIDRLMQLPSLIQSADRIIESLGMPTWALALVMIIALVSLVFAAREFLGWFLKTNAISDEVVRIEGLVLELQADLKSLEKIVERTKALSMPENDSKPLPLSSPQGTWKTDSPTGSGPHFPINH